MNKLDTLLLDSSPFGETIQEGPNIERYTSFEKTQVKFNSKNPPRGPRGMNMPEISHMDLIYLLFTNLNDEQRTLKAAYNRPKTSLRQALEAFMERYYLPEGNDFSSLQNIFLGGLLLFQNTRSFSRLNTRLLFIGRHKHLIYIFALMKPDIQGYKPFVRALTISFADDEPFPEYGGQRLWLLYQEMQTFNPDLTEAIFKQGFVNGAYISFHRKADQPGKSTYEINTYEGPKTFAISPTSPFRVGVTRHAYNPFQDSQRSVIDDGAPYYLWDSRMATSNTALDSYVFNVAHQASKENTEFAVYLSRLLCDKYSVHASRVGIDSSLKNLVDFAFGGLTLNEGDTFKLAIDYTVEPKSYRGTRRLTFTTRSDSQMITSSFTPTLLEFSDKKTTGRVGERHYYSSPNAPPVDYNTLNAKEQMEKEHKSELKQLIQDDPIFDFLKPPELPATSVDVTPAKTAQLTPSNDEFDLARIKLDHLMTPYFVNPFTEMLGPNNFIKHIQAEMRDNEVVVKNVIFEKIYGRSQMFAFLIHFLSKINDENFLNSKNIEGVDQYAHAFVSRYLQNAFNLFRDQTFLVNLVDFFLGQLVGLKNQNVQVYRQSEGTKSSSSTRFLCTYNDDVDVAATNGIFIHIDHSKLSEHLSVATASSSTISAEQLKTNYVTKVRENVHGIQHEHKLKKMVAVVIRADPDRIQFENRNAKTYFEDPQNLHVLVLNNPENKGMDLLVH